MRQISVKVKTNAEKFEICEKNGQIRISLTQPPEKNRANKELIQQLKKKLNADVRITKGMKSSKKTIEIDTDDIQRLFQ